MHKVAVLQSKSDSRIAKKQPKLLVSVAEAKEHTEKGGDPAVESVMDFKAT